MKNFYTNFASMITIPSEQQDQEIISKIDTPLEANVPNCSSELISEVDVSDISDKVPDNATLEPPLSPVKSDKPVVKKMKPPMTRKKETPTYGRRPVTSGIPLRVKPEATTSKRPPLKSPTTSKPEKKSYRQGQTTNLPVINRNTLESQFTNNKKRLTQMHADFVNKQQPLLDMYKSLQRTQKQLEDLGKKVTLDDLKLVTLKLIEDDDQTGERGAGETPTSAATLDFKNSVESIMESFTQVYEKCLAKRDDMLITLENLCKSEATGDLISEIQMLKKEKSELQEALRAIVEQNEKKVTEIITNWQNFMSKEISKETAEKLRDLEAKIKQQQKHIKDAEEANVHLSRKMADNQLNSDKNLNELQDKITKLEGDLKKEKKQANDHLMLNRSMRSKLVDLEGKQRLLEEGKNEAVDKLRQIQDQMNKNETQWQNEKDELKKNEAALQQKFLEKQSQLDTRLKSLQESKKQSAEQQQHALESLEKELELKQQELEALTDEKNVMNDKIRDLEEKIRTVSKQAQNSDGKNASEEIGHYQKKIAEVQKTLSEKTEQINKMQNSMKTHAQLAIALKVEKDNALKYCTELRDVLKQAREDLDIKNQTIYKVYDKLVSTETDCRRLRTVLKEMEGHPSYERHHRDELPRCQLCMTPLVEEAECTGCFETLSLGTSNVSKNVQAHPHYVSESLIGMSVKKVDHIRAKIDSLKKIKLPHPSTKRRFLSKLATSQCHQARAFNNLRKQIVMRGRLYEILQKHADQSCEDFINLLKLTVSSCSEKNLNELKPSNAAVTNVPQINITKSYHSVAHFYDDNDDSMFSDRDDNYM